MIDGKKLKVSYLRKFTPLYLLKCVEKYHLHNWYTCLKYKYESNDYEWNQIYLIDMNKIYSEKLFWYNKSHSK